MTLLTFVFLTFLLPTVYPAAGPQTPSDLPVEKFVYAGDDPLLVHTLVVDTGLEVQLANLEQVPTSVAITKLDNRRICYTDRIRKHNGYSYHFAFDELPRGRYALTVTKGAVTKTQVLLVKDGRILCSDWK